MPSFASWLDMVYNCVHSHKDFIPTYPVRKRYDGQKRDFWNQHSRGSFHNPYKTFLNWNPLPGQTGSPFEPLGIFMSFSIIYVQFLSELNFSISLCKHVQFQLRHNRSHASSRNVGLRELSLVWSLQVPWSGLSNKTMTDSETFFVNILTTSGPKKSSTHWPQSSGFHVDKKESQKPLLLTN